MDKAAEYWRRTRRLTFLLLACWFVLTFGVAWFARDLNDYAFLGFPLAFYLAAQGALVIFLLIIWWYNRAMRKLDARFGIDED